MNHYYTLEPISGLKASWQPTALTNNELRADAGIKSNWSYRRYMQQNANEIMKTNSMLAINASGNNPYTLSNNEPVQNNPYLYHTMYESRNPVYGFTDSDLKEDFVKKQQRKARMVAPYIQAKW